jgi:hypothetical protein
MNGPADSILFAVQTLLRDAWSHFWIIAGIVAAWIAFRLWIAEVAR